MPETIDAAVALLGAGAGYRCLAGGGLIVPGMRGGERPAGLVSLRRIAALRGIERRADGSVRIGAMTPHAQVAASDLSGGHALVREAAGEIAHPVIRTMATIGGTLARADPSADYSCALLAAGAIVDLAGPAGARTIGIDDFAVGEDELIVAVTLPAMPAGASSAYIRFARVDGDYPAVTAAVRIGRAGGAVASARIAIGGCGARAYRVEEAEATLIGARAIGEAPDALFDAYVAASDPIEDLKGSADYRRMLIPGLLRRALGRALAA